MSADPDYAGLARQFVEAAAHGANDEVRGDPGLRRAARGVSQPAVARRCVPRPGGHPGGGRTRQARHGRPQYEVLNVVAAGPHVALEARWTGTLAVPLSSLPAGGEMRARFAIFFEFRGREDLRIRNYDCFEPW